MCTHAHSDILSWRSLYFSIGEPRARVIARFATASANHFSERKLAYPSCNNQQATESERETNQTREGEGEFAFGELYSVVVARSAAGSGSLEFPNITRSPTLAALFTKHLLVGLSI